MSDWQFIVVSLTLSASLLYWYIYTLLYRVAYVITSSSHGEQQKDQV